MTLQNEIVPVELTDPQRVLLRARLDVWHGAATPSMDQVRAFGYHSQESLREACAQFAEAIQPQTSLSRRAWTQVLFLAELGFVSDVQGAGFEWRIITGMYDEAQSLSVLRGLQRKLIGVRLNPMIDTLTG